LGAPGAGCVRSLALGEQPAEALLECAAAATSSAAPPIEPIAAIRTHNSGRRSFFWLSHRCGDISRRRRILLGPWGRWGPEGFQGMRGRDMGAAWVGFGVGSAFLPSAAVRFPVVGFIGLGVWQK